MPVTDNAADSSPDPMEGFAEAMIGNAPVGTEGQPERASAVDPTPPVEATETEEEAPEKGAESAAEEKPADAVKVNFDGFSTEQKATWERLYKAGLVTPEEIDRARTESLFQSAWTKKTMDHAEKRKSWEKEVAERRDDLALLDKIRGDERLHAVWLKMARGEEGDESSVDPDDDSEKLVSAKEAAKIADDRAAAREREARERTTREQAKYDAKRESLKAAINETSQALGLTPDQLKSYLEAEESALPANVDPILRFTPEDVQYRLTMRHEIAKAKAEADAAKSQLTRTTQKSERTAKASLPPGRRVADGGSQTPLQKTEADLGLDPEWSMVQGFGFRDSR